jgi:hypothetical protein
MERILILLWLSFWLLFLLLLRIYFYSMFSLLYSSKNWFVIRSCFLFMWIFSITIQSVQDQSHDLWRYQRFLLVNEFSKKPPLAPPFNIFFYIYLVVRYLVDCVRRYWKRRRFGMYSNLSSTFSLIQYVHAF